MTQPGIIHYPESNGFSIVHNNEPHGQEANQALLHETIKALVYREQYKPSLPGQGTRLAINNSTPAIYNQMQLERGWLIIDKVIIFIREQNKINVYQIIYLQMMNLKVVLRFYKVFFYTDLNVKKLKNILALGIGSSKKRYPAVLEHLINSLKKIFKQHIKHLHENL